MKDKKSSIHDKDSKRLKCKASQKITLMQSLPEMKKEVSDPNF